jgi:hypothetical protein
MQQGLRLANSKVRRMCGQMICVDYAVDTRDALKRRAQAHVKWETKARPSNIDGHGYTFVSGDAVKVVRDAL